MTGARWQVRVAALAAAGLVAATTGACGGKDEPKESAKTTAAAGAKLNATEKEFAVALDQTSVAAGNVRVTVHNGGKLTHEFVGFKTDLPADQLPLNPADKNEVDEHGAGITHIDPEAEDIAPGTSKTITLHLTAGRYVFICNVATHYGAGMHTELTVT